jgi:hypothetical protein
VGTSLRLAPGALREFFSVHLVVHAWFPPVLVDQWDTPTLKITG